MWNPSGKDPWGDKPAVLTWWSKIPQWGVGMEGFLVLGDGDSRDNCALSLGK